MRIIGGNVGVNNNPVARKEIIVAVGELQKTMKPGQTELCREGAFNIHQSDITTSPYRIAGECGYLNGCSASKERCILGLDNSVIRQPSDS